MADVQHSDPIVQLEARQSLGDYERFTVPACISQLETHDVGPSCAIILGLLEDGSAYEPLKEAQQNPDLRKGHKRRIARALEKLEAN